MATVTERETFSISRSLEYLSEAELTKQIGYPRHLWLLALVKELVDNALDNCEEVGTLPEITVTVTDDSISVQDNGNGIPPETVVGMLDFDKRMSSREAYRSLTRGAQGNAGKCIVGIPYVWNDGEPGGVTIKARGVRHEIQVSLDQLAQQPKVEHLQTPEKVKNGTFVKVHLALLPSILDQHETARFLLFCWRYAVLNPHLTLALEAFGKSCRWERTEDSCGKWTAAEADPPAWYDQESFERLLAACIAKDRDNGTDRPLRDFVRGFAGLSGSAKLKAVCDHTELTRCNLSALVNCNGLDRSKTESLLRAMQEHGKEPKPTKLGAIGREHIEGILAREDVANDSIQYKRINGCTADGLPFVVEAAFAELQDSDSCVQIITGCNFSPSVDGPVVRILDGLLEHQMIDDFSPVVVLLHIATPAPKYLDRGKSVIHVSEDLKEAIEKCVVKVTSEWRKQKKLEERDARLARKRQERRRQEQRPKTKINEAVVKVLPQAIEKASGGGVVKFSQRDFYYATRQLIQEFTEKKLEQKYFDRIVDQYEEEHGLIDGRLRDPRGYLLEPHTGNKIPLGTKAVDEYEIPLHLFGNIIFFEKKGMESKCAWGMIPERYDCAIMACEGYAVRAAKALLQAAQRRHKMKVFCFHDADPAGYNIFRTLSRATGAHRYYIEVIDAGLHLAEALEMDLAVETFDRKKRLPRHLELTELEHEYFTGERVYGGGWRNCKRVELNALSADPHRFVEFVESKLAEHDADKKLIPPKKVIEQTARGQRDAILGLRIQEEINAQLDTEALIQRVTRSLKAQVETKSIPAKLKTWAQDLPPDWWKDYVRGLVKDSIADLQEAIAAKVEEGLSA